MVLLDEGEEVTGVDDSVLAESTAVVESESVKVVLDSVDEAVSEMLDVDSGVAISVVLLVEVISVVSGAWGVVVVSGEDDVASLTVSAEVDVVSVAGSVTSEVADELVSVVMETLEVFLG